MGKSWLAALLGLLLVAGLAAPGPASQRREESLPNLFAFPLSFLLGPETGQIWGSGPGGVDPVVIDGCLPQERAEGAERCLRFLTKLANLDRGALELAFRVEPSGRNVYQVVDGVYRPAGTFTVEPTSGAVVVEDFYAVRLWRFDGSRRIGLPVASTGRRGLCPGYAFLPGKDTDCLEARVGPSGPESVVWLPWRAERWYMSDRYGQFIEISGVRDGRYVLEIEIDPLDHFAESYEPDNSTCVVIVLRDTEVRALRHDYCWPERTPVGDRNRARSA